MMGKVMIGRFYIRRFQQSSHVARLLGTVETHVKGRVAAVTASLHCYVPLDDPNTMIEFWEYLMKNRCTGCGNHCRGQQ